MINLKTKYRVVTYIRDLFIIQQKPFWSPFWLSYGGYDCFSREEQAWKYLKGRLGIGIEVKDKARLILGEQLKSVCNLGVIKASKDNLEDTNNLTRVEIIDRTKNMNDGGGRVYASGILNDVYIWCSMQDDGRTLKVFIDKK